MKKTFIPLLAALLVIRGADAQTCKYLPADCPVNGVEDYGTGDDSLSRLNNPVLPQEITMENQLRRWTGTLVGRVAASQGWQVYQLSEEAGSGFSDPRGVIIPYALRPPHAYTVTWAFIVNSDSLQAWQSWLSAVAQQRLDALHQYASSQTGAYDRSKPDRDSAEHYAQLMAQYMQDHMAQYQKDISAGNKADAGAYEKAVAAYQKKVDYFSRKAADVQKDPAAEGSAPDAEMLRTKQTLRFRDASLLIITFGFNVDYCKTAGTPSVAAASSSAAPVWFRNAEPDPNSIDIFSRSRNSVLLLEGDWDRKPDRYGGYRPSFESNKPSIDLTTPKRIRSDQVQAIDCQLSGNAQAIHQFLASVPPQEIGAPISRK